MEEKISTLYESFNDDENEITAEQDISTVSEANQVTTELEVNNKTDVKESDENESEPQVDTPEIEINDNANELSNIKNLIENLSLQFESKLKYDKHKDEIIDKLHAENQVYKNDLFKKIVSPFINEVIFLIDDYTNLFRKHSEMELAEINVAKLLKQFGNISEDLEDLLNKNGIESFTMEGDTVNFSKQKVIKTVATDVPEKDKTVCEHIKKGFVMDGKIIRQEQVSCYKFENKNINN